MAKFAVGQSVLIAFNPPAPDLRVPDQVNGKAPGRGDYQTQAERGIVLEVADAPAGVRYLVEVELVRESDPDPFTGKTRVVTSRRKRVIPEAKLTAV